MMGDFGAILFLVLLVVPLAVLLFCAVVMREGGGFNAAVGAWVLSKPRPRADDKRNEEKAL